jgi:NAD/NADP transhydrogenase beta subunit
MSANLAALAYLVAGVLFILALRGLSHPDTSRRGNLFGMIGMAIAVATTLADHPPSGLGAWGLVLLAVALGGGTGAVIARRVPMTSMPERFTRRRRSISAPKARSTAKASSKCRSASLSAPLPLPAR